MNAEAEVVPVGSADLPGDGDGRGDDLSAPDPGVNLARGSRRQSRAMAHISLRPNLLLNA